MREIPNLDYGMLKIAMKKKAIEVADTPPTPENQPGGEVKLAPGELGKVQQEIMALEGQLEEAKEREMNIGIRRVIEDKIKELKEFTDEIINSEEIQEMIEDNVPEAQIMDTINKTLSLKRKHQKMEGTMPLEKQLDEAIKEERYEDAAPIQEELNRFQQLVQSKINAIKTIFATFADTIVTADNLDLTEINKPYDEGDKGQVKKRHRYRFRNEPEGIEEGWWGGMEGYRNTDKGIGSDQYQDVGSPASINVASAGSDMPPFGSVAWQDMMMARIEEKTKNGDTYEDLTPEEQAFVDIQSEHVEREKKRLSLNALNPEKIKPIMRPVEVNMPNEKMERDPQQEKETTDTWREFYDMQQR